MSGIFKIRGAIKTYDWGKLGLDSCVTQLYKSAFPDYSIEENTPYAELWMGTHPSGMALIPSQQDRSLLEWMSQNPDSKGANIANNFDSPGLPFLFKVLSVRKALSIQVHPDKATAKKLYKEYPDKYPDDNHKPEIAIALTPFQALCGFRQLSEIKSFMMELPQLKEVVGLESARQFLDSVGDSEDLTEIFTTLITKKSDQFLPYLQDLVHHMRNHPSLSDMCKSIKNVFLKIHDNYPGDIGCFCIFFFNYIVLQPGQSIFLAANEPHAYLEGDCIECMACSDNVVRAGLTPKFKDVRTLCNILTYKCKSVDENIFQCTESPDDACVTIYDPPIPEFTVARVEVNVCDSVYSLAVLNSASLMIVVEGEAVGVENDIHVSRGTVVFISNGSKLSLCVKSEKILMYRAYCNEN